ncbi:MAG: phosphatidylglycerol lysyltransferase domain-containing protein [Brasilonema sp.]
MINTESSIINSLKNSDCHHLSILAANPDNEIFNATSCQGQVAYKIQGNYIFTIGGILAKKENKLEVYREFHSFAKEKRKKIIAIYLTLDELEIFKQHDYSINQLGSSYTIALKQFSFTGKRHATMRNKINKARRKGIIVKEVTNDRQFLSLHDQLEEIDAEWLSSKGGKALTFMVTDRSVVHFPSESYRLFVASSEENVLAYILYTRSYGEYKGWVHDLSRQRKNAPMGTLPLINLEAIEEFIKAEEDHLNFGFTPLADLSQEWKLEGKQSRIFASVAQFLQKYGDAIYPSQGQRQYKISWRPNIIKPEYIAFQGGFKIGALLSFLKITHSL